MIKKEPFAVSILLGLISFKLLNSYGIGGLHSFFIVATAAYGGMLWAYSFSGFLK